MICKCPQCDGALEYSPGIESMECRFCGNVFVPNEINKDSNSSEETMECQIYTCTSCAGELVVNDVEMATFCPYCGQPTIVLSRTSKERRPKYIIPFSIDKQEAIKLVRERFQKGIFVPKQIRTLSEDSLRGIYIPYYLIDIYYRDRQRLMGSVKKGESVVDKYFLREAECNFEKITCDASVQLNDESSQRLEPFNMKALKAFEPSYLSGFYADMYDENVADIEEVAQKRAETLFDKDMKKSCVGVNKTSVVIVNKEPKVKVLKSDYALLPVWFLTFRYRNSPYTLLINGQNGKIVGSIPFQKSKMIAFLIAVFLVSSVVCMGLCNLLYIMNAEGFENCRFYLFFGGLLLVVYGINEIIKNWRNVLRTKEKSAERFVKERQEKS